MNFDTVEFGVFFAVVFVAFFATPPQRRWMVLLPASYTFYAAWNHWYLALILLSTTLDFIVAQCIEQSDNRRTRRAFLSLSLLGNLGILFAFKYFNFFVDSAYALTNAFGVPVSLTTLNVILPVGISFYTFQTLSYTIEVYWGKQKAEHHFGLFALYVSFFPQLVAGPIERPQRLLPQFRSASRIKPDRIVSGLRLTLWGLFKKIVVSDNLAVVVDAVYGGDSPEIGAFVILATFFFAIQVYCDFSAYSDIAVGVARILGYDLMVNFNRPYRARSIGDLWRRWHISLTSWFRDYVYIPIGGNKAGLRMWIIAILAVYLLSGLWHGANWTYVLWGALHCSYYFVERFYRAYAGSRDSGAQLPPAVNAFLSWALTFTAWCFALIFFRAESLGHIIRLLESMIDGWRHFLNWSDFQAIMNTLPVSMPHLGGLFVLVVIVNVLEVGVGPERSANLFEHRWTAVRWTAYILCSLACLNAGIPQEVPFIYFQF